MRLPPAFASALAVSACLVAGCSRSPKKSGPLFARAAGQNLLLITLDTTRADRLGCYGHPRARTPALDSLAGRGALFERAYCEAPLTLVSHASILTGRFPREHGIHDNGSAALAADRPTLATLLKQRGYHTGAFVGAFVLDHRYGLNQGFDHYDDDMGFVPLDARKLEVERPGNIVTDRALAWLDRNKSGPFFAWVHYYDPHHPYAPPPPYRDEHADPYDGELAFVDSQVRRLLDWLKAAGAADKTAIIVAGDHGESFNEHGERGHSMFLYETNLHTPLLFVGAGISAGTQVSSLVQLTDIFPTALELLGVEGPADLHSRSLGAALAGQKIDDQECYSESLSVYGTYGYAEQRALTTADWKYISSTVPELYDRRSDPGETKNLAAEKPELARDLLGRLLDLYESMPPGQAEQAAQGKAAQEGFAALGYLSAGAKASEEFLTKGLPDPKAMLPVINKLLEANKLIAESRLPQAVALLQSAARESPGSMQIRYTLGTCLLNLGRPVEAMKALEAAAKIRADSPSLMNALGDCHMRLNQPADAARHYLAALALDDLDADAHLKLARAYAAARRPEDALREAQRAAALRPDFADALFQIGFLLAEAGRPREAIEPYRRAAQLRAEDATIRFNLGVALLRVNELAEAEKSLREAIRLQPNHGNAMNNLGVCLAMQTRTEDAMRVFRDATKIPDAAADAYVNIALTLQKQGRRAEALAELERVLPSYPAHDGLVQMISREYLSQRRIADAIRALREALQKTPDNLRFVSSLAMILATAQDDKLRDGRQALELAERAAQATNAQHPGILATLAAAQAETGDTARAVATAEKARQLASAARQDRLVETISQQLAAYREGKAYRDPRY